MNLKLEKGSPSNMEGRLDKEKRGYFWSADKSYAS